MLARVSIGPLPGASARAWLTAARETIALLHDDGDIVVPADVLDAFERYVGAWALLADEPVFTWSDDVDVAEVRRIGLHWAHLATIARAGHGGLSTAPPEAAPFYAAIAETIAGVLVLDEPEPGEPDVVAREFADVVPGFDDAVPETGRDAIGVMLVDDNDDVRMLLRIAMERVDDLDVVGEAADGRSAVLIVRDTRPDVVVLDVEMPGMSGLDALPEIRIASPETVVVMFSSADAEREALAAGAAAFLDKSTPMAELTATIRRTWAARRA